MPPDTNPPAETAPQESKPVKDQLTSGYLTHELRAPLASIRFALELFLDENAAKLQTADRRLLDLALRNVSKLNLLINDIMDLSKIQTGRLKMQPEPVDPVKLARETAGDMDSWVRHAGLKLTVTVPENCPQVFVDRRRTVQALTNLISNAIKFTPSGGSIEVTLKADDPGHAGFVVLSVKDTGCGIAPEDILKVFGYFVQAGPQDKHREGSGLGLPLARSMMEIQGGTMWVNSRPGEGSTFIFTMPVYVPGRETPAGAGR